MNKIFPKMTKIIQENIHSSPEERAKRLKRLRHLANVTKTELCELGEININTLTGWEVAKYGGLPRKGAEKVLAAVAKKGVQCSLEWLMHEIGKGPTLLPDFEQVFQDQQMTRTETISFTTEEEKIIEELLVFKQHYKHVEELKITDDGMEPFYSKEDYVAGIKRFKKDIKSTIGFDCIVQIDNGKILLRRVRPGSNDNTFSLMCMNLNTTLKEPILPDVKLVSSAPIVWHRRKNIP